MKSKRIFKKHNSNKKIFYYFIFILFFILFYIYFFSSKFNDRIIFISDNKDKYYIVPKDKGGAKVTNLDKKSLNLKSQEVIDEKINNPKNLSYTIQFYASDILHDVTDYLNNLNASNESIYYTEDFYILALNTDNGITYFLLYKNFETRQSAKTYCLNLLPKNED